MLCWITFIIETSCGEQVLLHCFCSKTYLILYGISFTYPQAVTQITQSVIFVWLETWKVSISMAGSLPLSCFRLCMCYRRRRFLNWRSMWMSCWTCRMTRIGLHVLRFRDLYCCHTFILWIVFINEYFFCSFSGSAGGLLQTYWSKQLCPPTCSNEINSWKFWKCWGFFSVVFLDRQTDRDISHLLTLQKNLHLPWLVLH